MKKYLLPLILILFLTFTLIGDCAWLEGWDYRIEITLPNYAGDIGGEVTWFPVDVFLTATQAEEVFAELTTDTEYNLMQFTEANGTSLLYGHKILFDVSETKGIFRVSATGWTINANTSVFLYYDKDHAPNDTYIGVTGTAACEAVYNAEYVAVYTMDDVIFTDWDTQYEGDVEPEFDGWVAGGTDYASSDGDILTIDTTGDSTGLCYYSKTPDINFDAGFYYRTRVQIHTDTSDTGHLQVVIQDGTQNERTYLNIFDGKLALRTSGSSWTDIIVDTTSAYHIYELYIKGTTVKLYMDGVLIGTEAVEGASVSDSISFGDRNGNEGLILECMIDYLYYALGVTDNPLLTILDSTSNNNDGTKKDANEPNEVTGKIGQAQDFDGDNDYIEGTLNPITNQVTVSVWIKTSNGAGSGGAGGGYAGIIGDGGTGAYNQFLMRRTATPAYEFVWDAQFGQTTIPANELEDNVWHLLTGTYDGSYQKIYLDGGLESSYSYSGNITSSNNYRIGRYEGGSNQFYYFNGIIDNPRISNTVRTAAWDKGTYNSGSDTLFTYGSEEEAPITVNAIFFGMNF